MGGGEAKVFRSAFRIEDVAAERASAEWLALALSNNDADMLSQGMLDAAKRLWMQETGHKIMMLFPTFSPAAAPAGSTDHSSSLATMLHDAAAEA